MCLPARSLSYAQFHFSTSLQFRTSCVGDGANRRGLDFLTSFNLIKTVPYRPTQCGQVRFSSWVSLGCVKLTEELASPWGSGYSLGYTQNIMCIHFLIVRMSKQTHLHLRVDEFYNSVFTRLSFAPVFQNTLAFRAWGILWMCPQFCVLFCQWKE